MKTFFNKKPGYRDLEMQAQRAACFFDHSLTSQQAKALAELLDVARQAPDEPIIVIFGNRLFRISGKQIIVI